MEALWKELEKRLIEKSVKLGIDYIITSSYGYVSREKGETESLENLMHRADEKMYAYKFETKSSTRIYCYNCSGESTRTNNETRKHQKTILWQN